MKHLEFLPKMRWVYKLGKSEFSACQVGGIMGNQFLDVFTRVSHKKCFLGVQGVIAEPLRNKPFPEPIPANVTGEILLTGAGE